MAWLTGICRNPGEVSALPGGEVSLPPIEGTSEGIVVWERVASDLGALEEPVRIEVRGGRAVAIDGGVAADRLRDIVATIRDADNIGEIGIGLNPAARIADDITEAKKALGTVHVALGDSANEYGGLVECEVHLDGLVMSPTIEFDGRPVVVDGRPRVRRAVIDLPGSEGQGDHRPDARRGGRRPANRDRRSARGRPCVGLHARRPGREQLHRPGRQLRRVDDRSFASRRRRGGRGADRRREPRVVGGRERAAGRFRGGPRRHRATRSRPRPPRDQWRGCQRHGPQARPDHDRSARGPGLLGRLFRPFRGRRRRERQGGVPDERRPGCRGAFPALPRRVSVAA